MADAILEEAGSPSKSPKDRLHDIMAQKPFGHVFFQHDLAAMGVADDAQALRQLIQDLASAQLVQIMTHEGEVCYRVRAREEAARLLSLKGDEHVIYNHIAESRTSGCWVKSLKARTNLHTTNLGKVIKSLEAKRLIKNIKNAKFPSRKIYMLSELNPSEDVTGGPWFTEGKLDIDLVEALADLTMRFVRERSWGTASRKRLRNETNPKDSTDIRPDNAIKSQKDGRPTKQLKSGNRAFTKSTSSVQTLDKPDQTTTDVTNGWPTPAPLQGQSTNTTLASTEDQESPLYPPQPHLHPIPPSIFDGNSTLSPQASHNYPTTIEICDHIRRSEVTSLSFSDFEFQDLLNMLVWDGRLEDMGMNRYRSTRGALALIEREREQERQRENLIKTMHGDIEDLSSASRKENRKQKTTKDDEDGDDVVLGGQDWRKFNRLQQKRTINHKHQFPQPQTLSSVGSGKLERDKIRLINGPPKVEFGGLTNGYADAPCAECPVFSICGEGGPVSAASCVFLEDWLDGGMQNYEGLDRNFHNLEALIEWQPS